MGLGLKKHITALLGRYVGAVSVLLCLVCLGMTALLPVVLSRGTYFSENSLMVGSATSAFDGTDAAWVAHHADRIDTLRGEGGDHLLRYVAETLAEGGGGAASDRVRVDEWEGGRNVVATVPSHRGTGTGSMIFAASSSDAAGVAALLRLSLVLSTAAYLGLDLHTVVVFGGFESGLQAFADGVAEDEVIHSSAVRAAVVLDLRASGLAYDRIRIRTLSRGAAQPNMDLVNSVSRLCSLAQTPCSVLRTPAPPSHELPAPLVAVASHLMALPNVRAASAEGIVTDALAFWQYLGEALSGEGAVHSPLRAVGIHTVTLEGVGNSGGGSASPERAAAALGSVLSGSVRAMNNLCERLHQSFWVYFYTNDGHFVDYDSVQPQCWLGVGAVIAATLAAPQSASAADAAAGVVATLGLGLAALYLAAPAVDAAAAVAYPLLVATGCGCGGPGAAAAVRAAAAVGAAGFLCSATVLCCPVAIVGAAYCSALTLVTPRCRGASGYAACAAGVCLTLCAAWAVRAHGVGTAGELCFFATLLPYSSACAAAALPTGDGNAKRQKLD